MSGTDLALAHSAFAMDCTQLSQSEIREIVAKSRDSAVYELIAYCRGQAFVYGKFAATEKDPVKSSELYLLSSQARQGAGVFIYELINKYSR